MILSVGEILADIVARGDNLVMKVGGAPFNVAAGIAAAGGKSAFLGRVGDDTVGRFLTKRAAVYGIDFLDVQIDEKRNTTLAFVTLNDGERSFSFFRNNSADYNIDLNSSAVFGLSYDIIHLGSLMLSREEGRAVARDAVKRAKDKGSLISFDVNFRFDLFESEQEAFAVSKYYVDNADIVKFNDEEIAAYTGESDSRVALKSVWKPGKTVVLTEGKAGSGCICPDGTLVLVQSQAIGPIDTTGAGDAFFGAFLAAIDGKELNPDNAKAALVKANAAGAKATQYYGALGYLEK